MTFFPAGVLLHMLHYCQKKYKNIIINDSDDTGIQLFNDAIEGRYQDETRWISREDFEKLKDRDPYVRHCWSFGNNCENYLYSKEVESWKKALHYAKVYGDNTWFRLFDIDKICHYYVIY